MRVLVRVDAGRHIGSGHVMRCLTVARALQNAHHDVLFVMRDHLGHLDEVVRAAGMKTVMLTKGIQTPSLIRPSNYEDWLGCTSEVDATETILACRAFNIDCVIVDHYALGSNWESAIRAIAKTVVAIDDLANREHDCDVLIDQTLGRTKEDYMPLVPASTDLLLGTEFALLRPEFVQKRDFSVAWRRNGQQRATVLISLGGVDQENITSNVLRVLKECALPQETTITVLMGHAAPWIADVKNVASQMPWSTKVLVGADNVASLMCEAAWAIGAAGGTSWERCCMALPTIMLVLAENQLAIAKVLSDAGAVLLVAEGEGFDDRIRSAVHSLAESSSLRMEMSRSAGALVDGKGAARLLEYIERKRMIKSRLRPMTEADLEQVLDWRNHESVRSVMFDAEIILMKDHRAWFRSSSQDLTKSLLIFEREGVAQGYVNFKIDRDEGEGFWGFYVAPTAPPGSGTMMATLAIDFAFETLGLKSIRGEVLAFNERSLKFHTKLGFQREGVIKKDRPNAMSDVVVNFVLRSSNWKLDSRNFDA